MTTAADLMRPCLSVRCGAAVADVVDRLEEWPACAVVNDHDKVVGILTEHDLAKLVHESGQFDRDSAIAGNVPAYLGMNIQQLRAVPVTDLMTEDPDAVAPGDALEEILLISFRNRRNVLLVVENGHLLGAVYRMDAIKKVLG